MAALGAGSDTKLGIVLHTTGKILRAAKNLHESKQETSSTTLSPSNRSPPTPLMEIIPPSPLSHRLQVTTPLESATLLASSDDNFKSTPELQPSTETQYIPLTEGQIDDAKSIVLDLLGWGVSPEYLVTSGVHPELIYRIFTDLNLRLPTNLALYDDR